MKSATVTRKFEAAGFPITVARSISCATKGARVVEWSDQNGKATWITGSQIQPNGEPLHICAFESASSAVAWLARA